MKRTVIPTVPDNLLYTLIHSADATEQKSVEMNVEMECGEPMILDKDAAEMMEIDDDCDPMETERNIELMDTDDESDNDFESARDSDIEFMNDNDLEEERSIYRRFENTF